MIQTFSKHKDYKLTANFKAREFDCKCGKSECSYTLLDDKLLAALQSIRSHFKKPVVINSGYRCRSHNAAVGGSSASRHLRGQAADIVIKGVSPQQVAAYAETIGIKGIGLYNSFTHIDTRQTKFYWKGSKQKPQATFKN